MNKKVFNPGAEEKIIGIAYENVTKELEKIIAENATTAGIVPPNPIGNKYYAFYDEKGSYHNEGAPAYSCVDGIYWYSHGKFHREDGPAIEKTDGRLEWWIDGKRHRNDGPAVIGKNGYYSWYKEGKLHKLNGPAHCDSAGIESWYYEGIYYPNVNNQIEFEAKVANTLAHKLEILEKSLSKKKLDFESSKLEFESFRKKSQEQFNSTGLFIDDYQQYTENNITGTIIVANLPDTPCVVQRLNGDKEYYYHRKLHRINGPSIEFKNGDALWYMDGKLHRDGAPAVENKSFNHYQWSKLGVLHRVDGPASYDTVMQMWYYEGKRYNVSSQEEFENQLYYEGLITHQHHEELRAKRIKLINEVSGRQVETNAKPVVDMRVSTEQSPYPGENLIIDAANARDAAAAKTLAHNDVDAHFADLTKKRYEFIKKYPTQEEKHLNGSKINKEDQKPITTDLHVMAQEPPEIDENEKFISEFEETVEDFLEELDRSNQEVLDLKKQVKKLRIDSHNKAKEFEDLASSQIEYVRYVNGAYHSDDGPAITYKDGKQLWYFHGKYIPVESQKEFEQFLRLKNKKEHMEKLKQMKKETSPWDMVKSDAGKAAYRIAGNQITKGTKQVILSLLEKRGSTSDAINTMKILLDSEIGDVAVSALIGMMLTFTPGINQDERVQKLAEEFRIASMATAGNAIFDVVRESFLPVITEGIKSIPTSFEEKTRIAVDNDPILTTTEEYIDITDDMLEDSFNSEKRNAAIE